MIYLNWNYIFEKKKIFDLLGVNKIGVFDSFARNKSFNDINLIIEDDIKAELLINFYKKTQ